MTRLFFLAGGQSSPNLECFLPSEAFIGTGDTDVADQLLRKTFRCPPISITQFEKRNWTQVGIQDGNHHVPGVFAWRAIDGQNCAKPSAVFGDLVRKAAHGVEVFGVDRIADG